jgi:hypothetical protein
MDFPDYAFKYSKQATESKASLPGELLPVVDDILNNTLAYDPVTPRPEILPAGRDGKTFIYMHVRPQVQITYEVDVEKKVIFLYHFVAPTFSVKKLLFISYSHRDAEWLGKLKANLSQLVQEGVIDFWVDEDIAKGLKWRQQIEKALADCRGGLLLVSPDFLQSAFITDVELPALLNEAAKTSNKKIFWVQLRKCDPDDARLKAIMEHQSLLANPTMPLSEYNDDDKAKALVKIAGDIRTAMLN